MFTKRRRFLTISAALILGLLLIVGVLNFSASPAQAEYLVISSNFENGTSWPWVTSETFPGQIDGDVLNYDGDGDLEFCVTITHPGKNRYDVQARHRRLHIEAGHHYVASFTAFANRPAKMQAMVTQGHAPYWPPHSHPGGAPQSDLTTSPQSYSFEFDGATKLDLFTGGQLEDTAAEFAFHLGGDNFLNPNDTNDTSDLTVCFDDLVLNDTTGSPPPVEPSTTSNIRVNQIGYFQFGPKKASVVSDSATPLHWELVVKVGSEERGVRLEGDTTLFNNGNPDPASGDRLHIIDFSEFQEGIVTPGALFVLRVNGEESHPFDIDSAPYWTRLLQPMEYFYNNRSGTALVEPYAGPYYTRGAGYIDETVPCITGGQRDDEGIVDGKVTDGTEWVNCVMTVDENGVTTNNPPMFTDDYTVSAPTGWYDAGDHGKYVVNGGISAWTMLNQYERHLYWGRIGEYWFGDGTLSIPENNNGVPDILDEARWEVELLLDMQVPPEGQGYTVPAGGVSASGLVHHMLHDTMWTDAPNRPDDISDFDTADNYERAVYPPSTAATLNLAAVGAQCARIWRGNDDAFADRCLDAATRAWDAANAHPDLYAEDRFNGGGPYDDAELSDEFYWAAAELYVTTGADEYLQALMGSTWYGVVPTTLGTEGSGPMTWKDTAALGTISLAMVPNNLGAGIDVARQSVIDAADVFVANEQTEGYGTPYKAGSSGYAWGSNSFVLNEMIIMGLAHDFTDISNQPQRETYKSGIVSGLDYLMGRNAMDVSYVTSWSLSGNQVQNVHHRHWAYQAWPRDDIRYPSPIPGSISGGPNSNQEALSENKATRAMGLWAACNTTPMKCYADDIDAFAVNEVTINWNAPFLWVLAFISEEHPGSVPHEVDVQYVIREQWPESDTYVDGIDVTRIEGLDRNIGLWTGDWLSSPLMPINSVQADSPGFTADVTITNKSDEPINGWTLTWTFPGNQQIYEMWNAGYSQSGAAVKVWDTVDWNSTIAANGGTVTFGFNANFSGENAIPTDFVVIPGSVPGPGTDLPVDISVNNDWGDGYCAVVTVTNDTDEPVDWQIAFETEGTIYDFWNAIWSQNGANVKAEGMDWNNILQPGESTHSIGFCANR
ncbi:MAG: glycoside hydrolase family 9 protein [Anaerolineae bacterium]|nr:glycoside hydrolase family 9 protein [Anaerolineae bacterium]